MIDEATCKELKRIGRKARRFSTRNKKGKPAKFTVTRNANHPGVVLLPIDLGKINV